MLVIARSAKGATKQSSMERDCFLRLRVFVALWFLGLAVWMPSAYALDVPKPTGRYVSDFADLLSSATQSELEGALAEFDRQTSSQIIIVILPSLQGDSLEDFSIRLAKIWKPGTAKKDNGAILLIFKDDRAVRIEVGYGLEGALPDAVCSQIIRNQIVPAFRSGNYDAGVRDAAQAMMAATRGEYQAAPNRDDESGPVLKLLYVLMILYIILPWVAYPIILIFSWANFGLVGLAGGLVVVLLLAALRHAWMKANTFGGHGWSGGSFGGSSGGSGGGFGGGFSGGGGSFGGGGASGRW